jgi:DNA polymerase/3'-5' exonuclease PolX
MRDKKSLHTTATKENWGFQFAIRTGSAKYSHEVLGNRWAMHDYKGVDGNLTRDGKIIPVYEEEDLFRLIRLPYVPPEERNL